MATYRYVDKDVQMLANSIIAEHHEHLKGQRVDLLFRSEAQKTAGKTVLGKARKISGLNAFLSNEEAQPYFVIELAEDVWGKLTEDGRKALIDHELTHCNIEYDEDSGEAKPYIAAHDVEEFAEIIRRHGLWQSDLEEFGAAVQLTLSALDDKGIDSMTLTSNDNGSVRSVTLTAADVKAFRG